MSSPEKRALKSEEGGGNWASFPSEKIETLKPRGVEGIEIR